MDNQFIYDKIDSEILRAIELHGLQEERTIFDWFIIMQEEVGEVSKEVCELMLKTNIRKQGKKKIKLKKEIIHSIAMLVNMYNKI